MEEPQPMYLVREDLDLGPCWEVRHCSVEQKEDCIVWQYEAGYSCWTMSGTVCQGQCYDTWGEKMKVCEQCEVFRAMCPKLSNR